MDLTDRFWYPDALFFHRFISSAHPCFMFQPWTYTRDIPNRFSSITSGEFVETGVLPNPSSGVLPYPLWAVGIAITIIIQLNADDWRAPTAAGRWISRSYHIHFIFSPSNNLNTYSVVACPFNLFPQKLYNKCFSPRNDIFIIHNYSLSLYLWTLHSIIRYCPYNFIVLGQIYKTLFRVDPLAHMYMYKFIFLF